MIYGVCFAQLANVNLNNGFDRNYQFLVGKGYRVYSQNIYYEIIEMGY